MKRTVLDYIADFHRVRRAMRDLPRSSTLKPLSVRIVLNSYRRSYIKLAPIQAGIFNGVIEKSESEGWYSEETKLLAFMVFNFLTERIYVTPFHVINIITRDPKFAHSDVAALNRGLFESAVNLSFLMMEDRDHRIKQFHLESIKQELKLQNSMKKWINSENEKIAKSARLQFQIKDATTQELLESTQESFGNVGSYPNIFDRCEKLGDEWAFEYDSKYRGLSSWQHGDTSRVFASQYMKDLMPEEAERTVFESLAQCAWCWDFVFKCTKTMLKISGVEGYEEPLQELNERSFVVMAMALKTAKIKFHGG